MPLLEKLEITFLNQLTFSVPRLQQFLSTTDANRFNRTPGFKDRAVYMIAYPRRSAGETLSIHVRCAYFNGQVSFITQILNTLVAVSSVVEHHALDYKRDAEENKAGRTWWRSLLRQFGNVKTLHVARGLITELSCALQPEDGESPLELLPELQALEYPATDQADDPFSTFNTVRENIGRLFSLVHTQSARQSHEPWCPAYPTADAWA